MKIYYHGSASEFDKFDLSFSRTGNGNEQYGAGIYLTSDKEEAGRYAGKNGYIYAIQVAGTIHIVEVPASYQEEDTINEPLSPETIRNIINDSPDKEEVLWNFGDVDYEGVENVLDIAVDSYTGFDILPCINMIGNDFYDKKNDLFLKSVQKHTKIDGFKIKKDENIEHLVIFSPDDISIVKREYSNNIESLIHSSEESKMQNQHLVLHPINEVDSSSIA